MNDRNEGLQKFRDGVKELGISLTEDQYGQFLLYYDMLTEKNKVMNLTAITEFDEVVEKHFLDSLSLCKVSDLDREIRVLDLGTGAGFPGIPLKIAFPKIRLVLADSLNKRILFLREVLKALSLETVSAIHARAEELAENREYREQFDLCVSRAVANLSTLSEYCLPFVKTGGQFISYKSGEVEDEAEKAGHAIRLLGGKLEEIYRFQLNENSRSFVRIVKKKKTPGAYPRKAGTPSRSPL